MIYNVDCLSLMSCIKDNSIELVFADYPYNLSKSDLVLNFVKTGGKQLYNGINEN